jgi:hypothetical protein
MKLYHQLRKPRRAPIAASTHATTTIGRRSGHSRLRTHTRTPGWLNNGGLKPNQLSRGASHSTCIRSAPLTGYQMGNRVEKRGHTTGINQLPSRLLPDLMAGPDPMVGSSLDARGVHHLNSGDVAVLVLHVHQTSDERSPHTLPYGM